MPTARLNRSVGTLLLVESRGSKRLETERDRDKETSSVTGRGEQDGKVKSSKKDKGAATNEDHRITKSNGVYTFEGVGSGERKLKN